VLTSSVLIVILYAYFSQAARAQSADRIYSEAHQRIDLALVRGRCGLWDWDMARGRMFWSRSMYDMLGYEASDDDAVVRRRRRDHPPDDGDLFEVAKPSRRARSIISTRSSACATPDGHGSGCAPARRSSIPKRRTCT
jgi:PAS domain-containing protein